MNERGGAAAAVRDEELVEPAFTPTQSEVPSKSGMSGAFATLLAAVNELVRTDTWTRLKACSNPICHEAFFDRSRNASAIYHAAQCASMVGMRAYRARKKGAR